MARAMGLAGAGKPGVIIVGGSQFAASLAGALRELEVPVLVADANRTRLRAAREDGLPVFFGDILSEAAEHGVEIMSYGKVIAASDNDAYNTLVATDLAPEFGRDNVFQLKRVKQDSRRHALPSTLGGRAIAGGLTYYEIASKMNTGWQVRSTRLSEDYTLDDWREANPDAVLLAEVPEGGDLRILAEEATPKAVPGTRLLALSKQRETRGDVATQG